MGIRITMENKIDNLERRLFLVEGAVEDLLNSRRIWLTEELWLQTRCNSHGLDETIFYLGKEALDNNINMTMNEIKLLKNHLDDINVMYTVPDFDDLKVMEDK